MIIEHLLTQWNRHLVAGQPRWYYADDFVLD